MREGKLPLRTVLQNFINNVESLEASKNTKEDKYEREFQDLKKLTESLKNHHDFVCLEGEKECNRRKNRYKDILPYDKTRVVLQPFPGIPGSDYVNANYIRGASGSRAYIASQGPLSNTVPDFWRMVVECDVQVIVMASNETEGGKHKCECYWVDSEGEEKQFGNVLVSFVKSRQVCPDFLVRTLKIQYPSEKNKAEERTICQFHYMLWPDHGVPDTVRPLLDMVRLVRDCQASETLPVLVHCSAGCGRTGTICAIDYVWGLLRTGKLTDNLHLLGLVREMRVQRVAMVQTKEQYTLLHQAVKELFKERLLLIDSHPYENISTDGNPIFLRTLKDKESDYEELYVSQEKQDKSTKTSTPSNTPTSASTPSGSLTRRTVELTSPDKGTSFKDNLRSVSTSSIEACHAPPLPGKAMKQQTSQNASAPDYSVEKQIVESMLSLESDIQRLKMITSPVPDQTNISMKRPPSGHSKIEKEAENFAQKMESKEREKLKRSSGIFSVCQQDSSLPNNFTTVNPPKDTMLLPPPLKALNSLHGSVLLPLQIPPIPPPRSRTPSPIISIRKVIENQKKMQQQQQSFQQYKAIQASQQKQSPPHSPKLNRKCVELTRKPSIQKLKDLFDRPVHANIIVGPNGTKLCRSASSITSRPSLSVHNDMTMSLKVKRKGSTGWDESFAPFGKSSKEDNAKLQICPPPPVADASSNVYSMSTSGKPPSSPVAFRKFKQTAECDQKEEKNCLLLSKLDDRPALPLKKSKSFRWSRPHMSASVKSSSRSPESTRKAFDTYFSLDRAKVEHSTVESLKPEVTMKRLASDFPTRHEGLKLSVYEFSQSRSPPSSVYNSSEESLLSKNDNKPLIPPKKYIGDKLKNTRAFSVQEQNKNSTGCREPQFLPTLSDQASYTSLNVASDSSYENPCFWEHCTENLYDKVSPQKDQLKQNYHENINTDNNSVGNKLLNNTSATSNNNTDNRDYVNARVYKTNHDVDNSPRYVYVPLPSKRALKDKGIHDYANCNISTEAQDNDPSENFTAAEYVIYNVQGKLNKSPHALKTSPLKPKVSKNSLHLKGNDAPAPSHFFSDYEPVDFGESTSTNIDEVFETVNFELLEYEERQKKKAAKSLKREYYLNRDLDSIAIQVYKDCQEYLLHGNNRSPVPSLMPRASEKEDSLSMDEHGLQVERATEIKIHPSDDELTDLEEVRTKVAVPPQGLRSRERRHSYRQAVSPTSPLHPKVQGPPRKPIHKYEKIWFEASRDGEIVEKVAGVKDKEKTTNEGTVLKQDYSANLNRHMNISGKETLFKDKLQELQSFVSSYERKKLPDLSEEDLSSKDSGSTSSLFSRSAQSSRSSERAEPIYANTTMVQIPTSASGRITKSETSLLSGRHSNPLVTGASPYGTLATTTSYPYKPKLNLPPFLHESDISFIPYQPTHTATLPARSTISPSSSKSIPPPLGFSNLQSSSTSADSKEALHLQRSDYNESPSSPSPYYNLLQTGGQSQLHVQNTSKHRQKSDKTYYSKLPSNVLPAKSHEHIKRKPHMNLRDHYPINGSGDHGDNDNSPSKNVNECDRTKATVERAVPYSQGKGNSNNSQSTNPSLNPSVFYHRPPPPKPVRINHGGSKQVLNKFEQTNPSTINRSSGNISVKKPEKTSSSKQSDLKDHPNRRSVDFDLNNKHPTEQSLQKSIEQLYRRSMDQDQINRIMQENCNSEMPVEIIPNLPINGVKLPYANGNILSKVKCDFTSKSEIVSETSSTDTSLEEEGIFHKITGPNFLRKFRNPQVKNSSDGAKRPISPKSNFYPPKEDTSGFDNEQKLTLSPPASPRPLTKAFGKLKMGSKSVAANFKSYLSIKGSSEDSTGNSSRHNPLQKSASSGPSITVFSQVVEESKYINSIPKKPSGPRELPENFQRYNDPANAVSLNRPRQHYL